MRTEREHVWLRAATALYTVGTLLSLAPGCQLTSADQVVRSPSRDGGGSDGRDLATVGQESQDGPADQLARPEIPSLRDLALSYDRDNPASEGGGHNPLTAIDGSARSIDTGYGTEGDGARVPTDALLRDSPDGTARDSTTAEGDSSSQVLDEEDAGVLDPTAPAASAGNLAAGNRPDLTAEAKARTGSRTEIVEPHGPWLLRRQVGDDVRAFSP